MIGFGRLNHNSDFSFLHVKNPVGDFSPTGFVEQPKFYVAIQDFYEDLNYTSDETCYLEFSASDMEDIQKLLGIVNKHVYNKEDGDYIELVIE